MRKVKGNEIESEKRACIEKKEKRSTKSVLINANQIQFVEERK